MSSARTRAADDFPCSVEEIENVWIPVRDGCRLAARAWIPREGQPVPALLEYLPYRKRDFTRSRDDAIHAYFAGHGYACLRVDVRGTGDSDGILADEYTQQEFEDGFDVLAWIAAQPWCNGAVGMFGKSWGGFNALQIAARNPPELKAVISVCAADDRYADDAHFMGGCLLTENLRWGSSLFTYAACPPDPAVCGSGWREQWLERLQRATLFPALWMRHQRWDDYWRHGSVCTDYGAIKTPVLLFGGWADGYTNAIPRLLAGLRASRKAVIGPWGHAYPHDGVPGPAIGFLQEALRWWDHWLKGQDTGVTEEPILRAWMQDSAPPRSRCPERPGRWIAEEAWPPASVAPSTLHLGAGDLRQEPAPERALSLQTPPHLGVASGDWCPFSGEGDLPADQAWDDARSLTFDGPLLKEPLEILGVPEVELEIALDRPQAMLAVRLNDVAPGGASTRVSYGLLNLAQWQSREHPAPMMPGERVRVRVALNAVAHRFAAGNRIRVAISTNYWPLAWPSPESVTLTAWAGSGCLTLPVRKPNGQGRAVSFAPPEKAESRTSGGATHPTRKVEIDLIAEEVRSIVHDGVDEAGEVALTKLQQIGLEAGMSSHRFDRIKMADPLSAEAVVTREAVLRREGWSVRVETEMRMTATKEAFRIEATLRAYEQDREIHSRSFDETIPRDNM